MCSIPLIVKSFFDKQKNNRYIKLNELTIKKSRKFLSNILTIPYEDIFIFSDALEKDDAIINSKTIENHFRSIIELKDSKINLLNTLDRVFNKDNFLIKYLICAIKIDRPFKMSKKMTINDTYKTFDNLFLNDEMANLSEVLTNSSPNYMIYPVFDRLINISEIENSYSIIKKFLPSLICDSDEI